MTNHHLKPIVFVMALALAAVVGSLYLIARPPSRPPSAQPSAPSSAMTPAVNPPVASTPTISWNPASVTRTLFLGTVGSQKVTFTSETNLTGVSLRVVPELVPYVSVSPDHLDNVAANTSTTVTLFFAATPNQPIGTFDGTIQITQGTTTLAKPLAVILTVSQDTTPPVLSVLSPADNSTVSSSAIVVTGTVQDETPVAVSVNGVPAQINTSTFVANEVPLPVGTTTIVAVATDIAGNSSSQTVHVSNSSSFRPISIDALPLSGVAPLDVRFSAHPRLPGNDIANIRIDFEGDGVFDFSGQQLEAITHTYIAEGIYQATIVAEDDLGNVTKDSVAINVHPMPPLREMWSGMRAALIRGDIEGALSYFAPAARNKYEQIFTALGDRLIPLAQKMQDGNAIEFKSLRNGVAIFKLFRQESLNGKLEVVSHPIQFIVSEDGQWRIANF